jgi:hypothetical protein
LGANTSARGAWIATLALLLAALAANCVSLAPMLDRSHGDFDAIHLYFPLAQGLIDQGWRFFADPRSVQAPPFSYAYPALLGVSMHAVKAANAILSGVTLLAVFRSAWLMHSRAAGVVAAFLFALSPTLRPHLATPITEGPFILLCAVWFWGAAEWLVKGRGAALAASAVAICLAALTRATMFYAIVLLVGAAAVAAWRFRGDTRRRALAALVAYALSLLPIIGFIAKNWLLFGFPFYTTGGANALYLGNNPLTGGYDPNYLDLYFDVGAIAQNQSHLTLEAERLLGGAARVILAEKDAAFLAHMHLQKLAAFIFVTSAETNAYVERSWRIALVVLSAGAIPRRRSDALAWLLFATLAYQVAVHVPVLYTHRYSVDALDLWLVIAAGIGVARWGLAPKPWIPLSAIAATGLAVAAGAYLFRTAPAPAPDVFAVARWLVWQAPIPGGEELTHRLGRLDVPFGNAPWLSPASNHVVVVDAASRGTGGAACGPLRASFLPAGGARFSRAIELRIPADGAPHRLQHGAIPLGLVPEGTLRLEARCPEGAALRLDAVAVYAALGAIDYRSRFLGERLPMPVER